MLENSLLVLEGGASSEKLFTIPMTVYKIHTVYIYIYIHYTYIYIILYYTYSILYIYISYIILIYIYISYIPQKNSLCQTITQLSYRTSTTTTLTPIKSLNHHGFWVRSPCSIR